MTVPQEIVDRRLARAFADVLDYPRAPLGELVRTCEALVAPASSEGAAQLAAFRTFAEETSVDALQEAYTGAFDLDSLSDLDPTCYPYVGHHLFDENHKRSAFLVGLAERFRTHGFAAGTELPDHLVVLLRFAAACDDELLVQELVHEAIVPALGRMVGKGDGLGEPRSGRERYQQVLRALLAVLEQQPRFALDLEAGAGDGVAAGSDAERSPSGLARGGG